MTSKPLSLYARYQPTTCGIARWQLMQEYAQKSMSTTLPRNEFRLIGLPSGVFSQAVMPLRSGAGPQFSSAVSPVAAVRQLRVLVGDDAAEVQLFPDLGGAADLLLQRRGVVRNGALQHRRQIKHQGHRQQDRHYPCGDTDLALATAKCA